MCIIKDTESESPRCMCVCVCGVCVCGGVSDRDRERFGCHSAIGYYHPRTRAAAVYICSTGERATESGSVRESEIQM